ncbi:MAG: GTP 3',8-cyclase MoaA [bacterium]|nr:GTP 3',8-cyclase MoaA [bacterium]
MERLLQPETAQPERLAVTPREPLIDGFGRRHTYLRVSVTERCNLRCAYCMPPEGVDLKPRAELLTYEEIARVVRLFAEMGVNKVRFTGGEPLVRKDLETAIAAASQTPGVECVAITTNGVRLKRKARSLRAAGVNSINISLDTLRPDRFERITRRKDFHAVLEGIEAALNAGFHNVKLNVVVMGGVNDDEALDFIDFVKDRSMEVRFIEYMPFQSNGWSEGRFTPWRETRAAIERRYTLVPHPQNAGPSEVAKTFRIADSPASVGFITSISEHFCDGCNRLRVQADGSFKTCLFHAPETTLRDAMRAGASDDELERMIRTALLLKKRQHAPIEELQQLSNQTMTLIGG